MPSPGASETSVRAIAVRYPVALLADGIRAAELGLISWDRLSELCTNAVNAAEKAALRRRAERR